MMMNWKLFLGAGAVAVSLGLHADESDMSRNFMLMDTDGDGTVSIIEATGQLPLLQNWINVDKNLDGKLDSSEYQTYERASFFIPPDDPEGSETIGAEPH